MDFSFSSDQQLLKNSARAFLDEHCKPATVRLLWDDPRGESESMWKEMAQLGWLGDARATLAFLDSDLDWDPAAVTTRAEKASKGWTLSGTKRFVPWAHVANALLIPARAPEGPSLFLVDPSAAGLKLSPVQGMDLATRWVHLEMDKVPAAPDALLGAPGQAAPLLAGLLRRGAVGAAAEMLGAARRCLDMAVGYAKVREQFGQPIGSFQAIRHKCSEMLLEVENSHS